LIRGTASGIVPKLPFIVLADLPLRELALLCPAMFPRSSNMMSSGFFVVFHQIFHELVVYGHLFSGAGKHALAFY